MTDLFNVNTGRGSQVMVNGVDVTAALAELQRFRDREPLVQNLVEMALEAAWERGAGGDLLEDAEAVRDFKL